MMNWFLREVRLMFARGVPWSDCAITSLTTDNVAAVKAFVCTGFLFN
jgi:hypothetical protein